MLVTLCIAAVLLLIVIVLASRMGLFGLLKRQGDPVARSLAWTDLGPTPLGEKGYTPQGLTWVDGKLVFANSWKNTKARVYEIDPARMAPSRSFDMPEEAVHTSGLAWDGTHLWAVDYISNRAYRIELEASFESGNARVVGSFHTGLRGTSACCFVPWEGRTLFAISDFMRTRTTILVDAEKALAAGDAEGAVVFRYGNGGFSQGLEYARGHLWESENRLGLDVVNEIDLEKLRESGSSAAATIAQYPAPSRGVEDLAWDGKSLFTSDESDFRFYRATLDAPTPAGD
jgi:glutamine cyclotransferase